MREFNEQHLYRVLSEMTSKGNRNFSVTKVGKDYERDNFFVEQYLNSLKWCLEKNGLYVESPQCLQSSCSVSAVPILVIIGSDDDIERDTKTLVETIEACPQGPVLDYIKETFKEYGNKDKNWGQEHRFPEFLETLKREGKKGIEIKYGPKFYTSEQLKDIAKLFVFPRIDEIHPSSFVD